MSLANQILRRVISQSFARNTSTGPAAVSGQEAGRSKLWKKLSLFVALPAVGLCMVNTYLSHRKAHKHERPEFVPYEYLHIRHKRFPWGDGTKSFFHNPRINPLPDGYEK
ncbi:cytochrome c oxidase subunit 6A, mitochondrial-like [Topomyia yanbarensis]|uniref:cytochrome c oxidase subunit 6A, mitochondrial-like n=1 Tax=Topomyia yanbarensis TaxID=2498891 RepID=UPI00273CEA52|nr:cytochrome c oxidase subunit 6A, mitochondrial-like [Topomyia yanbarensis]